MDGVVLRQNRRGVLPLFRLDRLGLDLAATILTFYAAVAWIWVWHTLVLLDLLARFRREEKRSPRPIRAGSPELRPVSRTRR